jgi:hypothetical protein
MPVRYLTDNWEVVISILDALSGNASKKATKDATATLGAAATTGTNTIYAGRDLANGALGEGLNYLQAGGDQARGDLQTGAAGATGLLGQAGAVYDPLVAGGGAAYQKLLNATGANGAAGSAQAATDFQAAPGYTYARDEALGAVQRAAGARGDLAGGNATVDLLKTANGLADQGYQQYVNNLSGLMGGYTTGLAGQAGALTGQAGVAGNLGTALAANDQTTAQGRAGLAGTMAGINFGAGTAAAGIGNQAASGIASTLMEGAKQQNQASANVLGGLSSLAGGIGNFAGGNGISNLKNLFA